MRYLLIFFMGVWVLTAPLTAQADILGFFFPSLKKETYNPYETLKAPFADNPDQIATEDKSAQDLNVPHRTDGEIADWLKDMVPEVMSFQNKDYTADFRAKEVYFDQQGLANFRDFLRTQNIEGVVQSGQYNITTVIKDFPLLINEGVVAGRYRWLYQVPVMVTYLDRRISDYKDGTPTNQYFELTVQVGRAQDYDAKNEHHVFIETWDGKVVKGE